MANPTTLQQFLNNMLPPKAVDKRPSNRNAKLTEFTHAIELSQSFTDKVAEADCTPGRNVRTQLQDAFEPTR